MRRWNFIIGAVLVVLGGLLLLQLAINAMGIAFHIMWIFWPLILIGLGVWIIQGFTWGGWKSGEVAREDASIPLDGASEASVRVQHGAGRLTVGSGTAPDQLLTGSFGGGLESSTSRANGRLSVEMRIKERDVSRFFRSWTRGRYGLLDWDFRLNSTVPLSLTFETGANESRLTLTDLQVRELRLKTGASSTTIDLPARTPHTRLSIDSGAAAVRIRVPSGVAAQVRVNSALSGVHVNAARFPRAGDVYRSADWDSAQYKVEISVETGVGSIDVS
jgi:hypothetical protein